MSLFQLGKQRLWLIGAVALLSGCVSTSERDPIYAALETNNFAQLDAWLAEPSQAERLRSMEPCSVAIQHLEMSLLAWCLTHQPALQPDLNQGLRQAVEAAWLPGVIQFQQQGANPYWSKDGDSALFLAKSHPELSAWRAQHIGAVEDTYQQLLTAIDNHDFRQAQTLLEQPIYLEKYDSNGDSLIHRAIKAGAVEVLELLIGAGVGLETQNLVGETPLLYAVEEGSAEQLEIILNHAANPNAATYSNENALHLLAVGEQSELSEDALAKAELLLAAEINLNSKNQAGLTPLFTAVVAGNTPIIEWLLKAGVSMNITIEAGWTPLMQSVHAGNLSAAELLLKYGADVNLAENNGWQAIHLASDEQSRGDNPTQAKLIDMLLQYGADIEAVNNAGMTPLHLAAMNGRVDSLQRLIAQGASIDVQDQQGWTPLMHAVNEGQLAMVKLLLQSGADAQLKNSKGWNALMLTANSSNLGGDQVQANIAAELIKVTDSIDAQNSDGLTALHLAAWDENTLLTEMLIDAGADVNVPDNKGWNALMRLVYQGHLPLVQQMLAHGANPNAVTPNGWSPLHLVADNQTSVLPFIRAKIAAELIESDANLNALNEHALSPLHLATMNQFEPLATTLIQAGANLNLTSNSGWTSLMIAVNQGQIDIVKALLNAGVDIHQTERDGWQALHFVGNEKNQSDSELLATLAEMLVDAGADPNCRDSNGYTPLYMATSANRPAVVKKLLTLGADGNLAGTSGITPLMQAVNLGLPDIVGVLVEALPTSELSQTETRGWNALHVAANQKNRGGDVIQAQIANLLLSRGVEADLRTDSGLTALMLATMNGFYQVQKALLDQGANPNLLAEKGWSPLMYAAESGDIKAVSLLLGYGANPNVIDPDQWTALHFAANSDHADMDTRLQVMSELTAKGANVSAKTNKGITPLFLTVLNDRPSAANLLLELGANPNTLDNEGWSPLMQAVNAGQSELVQLLVEHGADVTLHDQDGWNALHIVANKDAKGNSAVQTAIAELLLVHGAEINSQNADGLTVLTLAIINERPDVIAYLLESGADPLIADNDGRDAYAWAQATKQFRILETLRHHSE